MGENSHRAAATAFCRKHALSAAVIALALVPFGIAVLLVYQCGVDTPFLDDWTFIEDWVKFKKGELAIGDLFSAHMEHRVTVPRIMALALHVVLGRDLRWQCAMTLALMFGTGWNIVRLLRFSTGRNVGKLGLPLLLMSSLQFCAVQWQALLWPIMFEVFVPIFALSLSLRVWASACTPWTALIVSVLCAFAGTWSFGNGLLIWPLLPVGFWLMRSDLDRKTLWKLTTAWGACAVVAGGLYALHPENSVRPEFAYEQGHDVTVAHSAVFFLKNLDEAAGFVASLLGSHLSRGLHLQNISAAMVAGGVSVALYFVAGFVLWRNRRDASLLRAAAPWMLLGAFSIGTAVLISVGRLWLPHANAMAVTVRYVSHAVPLTLALIALACVFIQKFSLEKPWLGNAGFALGGALFMLTGIVWVYGSRMMDLWSESRSQGSALLLFTNVMPDKGFLSQTSGGDPSFPLQLEQEMEKLRMLRRSPIKDLRLDQFKISRKELRSGHARFESLEILRNGTMMAGGYSCLPDGRPADLVLFTSGSDVGEEMIFGFSTISSLPDYVAATTHRDHEFLALTRLTPDITCRWTGPVHFASIPSKAVDIDAWALDVQAWRVYHIVDHRVQPNKRLPKGVFPNSD